MMHKPVCVVVGVGPGNGAAIASRFSSEGYGVALLARTTKFTDDLARKLDGAKAYACDVTSEAEVTSTFDRIRADLGEVEALVYNAGSGVWGDIESITAKDFEFTWRVNAFGALLVAKQVIPAMKRSANGSIILIGATASRRGVARTAAFAPAKAAQRSLAQSMARSLWPAGIHVAIVIIDGMVDLETTRRAMPDKPDSFYVKPADVAATVHWLSQQPSSAWAFEVEARPFREAW
jgi:NAD(P)-dependent dehydrogenase (short-subunit alcohol dehydrogenase family)